jgi:tetratricopeptide (TPR) repeat protein
MWQAVAQSSAFIQDVEDASRSFVSSKEAEVLGANEQLDELAARADQLQQSIAGLQQGAVANNKQGELEPRAVLEGARADLNEGRSLLSELQKKLSVKATAAIAGETSARTSARQAWNRGYQQFLNERYERARHEYESAIKLDSTYAPAYNSLGRLDLMSGDVPAARVHFENALAHDKQYVPALSNLALVYVKLAEDTKGDPKLRDTNLEHASGFVGEALKLSNYQPARRIRARIESMRAK